MHLRHIQPRSTEWYDALEADRSQREERLDPEQKKKLRILTAGLVPEAMLPPDLATVYTATRRP